MKLIVGLGNPGIEYQFTPHNMGFLAIDRIAEKHGVRVINRHCHSLTAKVKVGEVEALLAKPETFMNLSGMAVRGMGGELQGCPPKSIVCVLSESVFLSGSVSRFDAAIE